MRTLRRNQRSLLAAALAVAAIAMIVGGCSSTARTPSPAADPPGTDPTAAAAAPAAAETPAMAAALPKSGSQLWAERCGQCHNIRDPGSYSAAQWRVAVHHMRFRAFLTGQEERAITEFLTAK